MSIGATSGKTKSILTPHGCRSSVLSLKTKQEMESGDFSICEKRLLYYFVVVYLATKMLMAPYDV